MLTLARVELESMAGEGTLDDDALLDLGEVRWRTGDLPGAGDAATAYLDAGRVSTLALLIAAEAQAALGRPAEARRLAARALEGGAGSLDVLFAGMPRAGIWPAGTADGPVAVEGTATGLEADGAASVGSGSSSGPAVASSGLVADIAAIPAVPEPVALPDGPTQLEAARAALADGDTETAAVRLALTLRVAPKLAPAVLEAAGTAPGPLLDLVRGDAYRLVGREIAARRLFLDAIATLDGAAAPAEPAATAEPTRAAEPAATAAPGADVQVQLPFADSSTEPEET